MKGPEFVSLADVKGGRLVLQDEDGYRRFVRRVTGRQEVRIGPPKKQGQNDKLRGYYHGVVVEFAMTYTGYDHDEQHEWLKAFCLDKGAAREGRNGHLMQLADGRHVVIGGSTRREKLPTEDYWEYITRCRDWIQKEFATEDDPAYVPEPDPAWRTRQHESDRNTSSRRLRGDWDSEGVPA